MKKQLYVETNGMKHLNLHRNIRVKLKFWLIRFEGNRLPIEYDIHVVYIYADTY